jgi:uncharacterized protein (DUF779 family)
MPEPDQAPARGPEPAGPPRQAPTRDPGGQPSARISATPAAREAIGRLRAARGAGLMFVQSAGCCAGSVPMCFPAGEFLTGGMDLLLGVIEGCPFYIDARIYRSWITRNSSSTSPRETRRASRSDPAAGCTS